MQNEAFSLNLMLKYVRLS